MANLQALKNNLAWTVRRRLLARGASPGKMKPVDGPIVIAGLFSTANGIGRAARGTYFALKRLGIDSKLIDLSDTFGVSDLNWTQEALRKLPHSRHGTLILHLNGPETLDGLYAAGARRPRSWRIIGYWSWELDVAPRGWSEAATYLSEIWTLSQFSKVALEQATNKMIRVVPPYLCLPDATEFLNDNDSSNLRCLIMADSKSSLDRKNVVASVEAYLRAFSHTDGHRLTVKLNNSVENSTYINNLKRLVRQRSDVEVLTKKLSDDKVSELISDCDVLISLHRAEGFGLHLAEAMMLGKVVLATNWSGNCDFMTQENSVLVPAKLIGVSDTQEIYDKLQGASWADPNIDYACEKLKQLSANTELRKTIGKAASIDVKKHCAASNYKNALFYR